MNLELLTKTNSQRHRSYKFTWHGLFAIISNFYKTIGNAATGSLITIRKFQI